MMTFVLPPLGFAVGLFTAPMAAPYLGDVPRRRRVAMGLVVAALFTVLGRRAGVGPMLPALLYLAAAGALLGFIDGGVGRLPDRFTLPSYGIAAALLAAAAPFTEDGPSRFGHALIGMAAMFALYFVPALMVPSGIGMGDVKLAGVLGLYLGWLGRDAWMLGLLATYLLGGLVAVGIMIAKRTRKGEFPFGPSMLAGAFVAVLRFAPG